MRRLAFILAVVALALPSATYAMPGQKVPQFIHWAKHNAALHGFSQMMDQNTGNTLYYAKVRVNARQGTFYTEPRSGVVQQEWLSLEAPGDFDLRNHADVATSFINAVYNVATVADFARARVVFAEPHVEAWQGERYGYVAMHAVMYVMTLARFRDVLANIHSCHAVECTD